MEKAPPPLSKTLPDIVSPPATHHSTSSATDTSIEVAGASGGSPPGEPGPQRSETVERRPGERAPVDRGRRVLQLVDARVADQHRRHRIRPHGEAQRRFDQAPGVSLAHERAEQAGPRRTGTLDDRPRAR